MYAMLISHINIHISYNYMSTFHYKGVLLITYDLDNISRK